MRGIVGEVIVEAVVELMMIVVAVVVVRVQVEGGGSVRENKERRIELVEGKKLDRD